MRVRSTTVGLGCLVFLLCSTGSATAQLEISADAGLASAYAWRGLYVTNRPVLQASGSASIPWGPAQISASLWGNFEVGHHDARSAISLTEGEHGFDLTEWDPSLEVSLPLGPTTLALGATAFLYPNRAGTTRADESAEIYATLELPLPLSPTIGAWRDVDEIRGTYLAFGLSHEFKLDETRSLVLSGEAGWSHDQAEDYDALGNSIRPGNFAQDGFTHWEASIALPMLFGELRVEPSTHFIFGRDEWTRLASSSRERDVKVWFGITVGGSRTLGAR